MGPRHRSAGLTAAVVLAVTASALVAGRAPAQGTSLRVSMFGDSVMLGARDQLLAQFAGQAVTVDAEEDRSLLGAIDLFRRAGPSLGDVVVLDLGYNDAADPAVFRGRIDDAMVALAAVRRVLWLNQHDWGPGRAGMNAELAAAAARYPNLEVIDWNAEVTAHPDEVYGDAIHLTPAGQVAMASLVRQRYDRYVASLSPTTTTSTTTTPTSPPATTTLRAPRAPAASGTAIAGSGDDDDVDIGGREFAIGGGVVVVVLGTGAVLSVGRRARRGTRRGR